jgi:hypothetical protein
MFLISIDRSSSLICETRRVSVIEELGLGDQCKVVFKYSLFCNCEGETPWRRITVTSSLNEMSTDQLGDRMVVRGARGYFALPTPFLEQRLYSKRNVGVGPCAEADYNLMHLISASASKSSFPS